MVSPFMLTSMLHTCRVNVYMAVASKRGAALAGTVQAIRKRLDLTQAAFGAVFGVRRNTVTRWEMRLTVPRVGILFALLRMAETDAEALPIREELSGVGILRADLSVPATNPVSGGANQIAMSESADSSERGIS
jgi:transcriptional regulator with XRE-family HTH domain